MNYIPATGLLIKMEIQLIIKVLHTVHYVLFFKEQTWTYLPEKIGVNVLEDFIEAEFAESLHGVTNKGWSPSFSQLPDARFS